MFELSSVVMELKFVDVDLEGMGANTYHDVSAYTEDLEKFLLHRLCFMLENNYYF